MTSRWRRRAAIWGGAAGVAVVGVLVVFAPWREDDAGVPAIQERLIAPPAPENAAVAAPPRDAAAEASSPWRYAVETEAGKPETSAEGDDWTANDEFLDADRPAESTRLATPNAVGSFLDADDPTVASTSVPLHVGEFVDADAHTD